MIKCLYDSDGNVIAFSRNQHVYQINGELISWLEICVDKQSSNMDKQNPKNNQSDFFKDYLKNMPSALLTEGDLPPEMLELLTESIPPELLGKSKKKKRY